MGFEERERSRAGEFSLNIIAGVTLNAFRSCKATMEVYSRSHGAHKMVICYSPLEKTTGIFAGIRKREMRTASFR